MAVHLFNSVTITMAQKESDFRRVKDILLEFAESIDFDLDYQDFLLELGSLNSLYSPPSGAAFLLIIDGVIKGCIGIWRIKPDIAELKRFYIYPQASTAKNTRMMLETAVDWARQSGYKTISLDPADTMAPAVKFYRQAGFFEIQDKSSDPQNECQRTFELPLEEVPDFYKSRGYGFAGKSRLNALLGT
jgi:GNAT superfamily N-acetyltransferase